MGQRAGRAEWILGTPSNRWTWSSLLWLIQQFWREPQEPFFSIKGTSDEDIECLNEMTLLSYSICISIGYQWLHSLSYTFYSFFLSSTEFRGDREIHIEGESEWNRSCNDFVDSTNFRDSTKAQCDIQSPFSSSFWRSGSSYWETISEISGKYNSWAKISYLFIYIFIALVDVIVLCIG